MTAFARDVYGILRRIPPGSVLTYGDVARMLGKPGAARAVGMINSRNPSEANAPCHRLVGSDGSLHGYAFGGVAAKRRKLLAEGVIFNGTKVDLAASRWQP